MLLIDRPLITLTEYLVFRFQDRTGIPNWRLLRTVWGLFIVVHTLRFGLAAPWMMRIFITGWAILMLGMVAGVSFDRELQEYADEQMAIVPSKAKESTVHLLLRVGTLAFAIMELARWPRWLHHRLDATRWHQISDWLLVAVIYLSVSDTFPMTGPTFKERVKRRWEEWTTVAVPVEMEQ